MFFLKRILNSSLLKMLRNTSNNGLVSSDKDSLSPPTNNNNNNNNGAEIQVTHSETWEHNKRFTVYKVFVNCGGKNWFIFRRYNEFNALYDLLKKEFPNAPLRLPAKKLFGNLSPNFVEKRREGLDKFVQQLLSDAEILQHPVVREFFLLNGIERQPSPNPIRQLKPDVKRSPRPSTNDTESEEDILTQDVVDLGYSEKKNAKPSDFEFQKVIGKGSFGKVFLARLKSENKYYAVKVLQKEQIKRRNEVKHIMSERNVLVENINHPFLVSLHFSFQTNDKLYFVLTYLNGGEFYICIKLFFHLQKEKTFDEARARFYASEIASALGYLHSKNIIYRDLKPENLLLDYEGHVVLTDFGLCKEGIKGNETTATFCGTPEYLAPEVIQKQPYDKTVDWWCLGSVLFEMLFGLPPFYNRDHKIMYENILYKPLRIRTSITPAARDILTGLLNKKRLERLGAKSDFDEIKSHIFFIAIDWKELEERKIRPPFNPGVKNVTDVKNIDKDFLSLSIPNSVANPMFITAANVKGADDDFRGFSYAPPIEDFDDDNEVF